ncbi:uncharacterized protein LOC144706955 [Wolffia australiana]
MDSIQTPISSQSEEEDSWDTDGFVIPNLNKKDSDLNSQHAQTEPPSKASEEEKFSSEGRKEKSAPQRRRLKNKLKEAEQKFSGEGRENKINTLRELVGCDELQRRNECKVEAFPDQDFLKVDSLGIVRNNIFECVVGSSS